MGLRGPVLGYWLNCDYTDGFMLDGETRKAASPEERKFFDWRFTKDGGQHPATCPTCGRKTDPDYINANFKLKPRARSLALSSTFDGYKIVSGSFRAFCDEQRLEGLRFTPLSSEPGFYRLVVQRILEIDLEQSSIRQLYPCDGCHQFAGNFKPAGSVFKGLDAPLSRGLFRSDLEFAQAHEQHPVLLLGVETAEALQRAALPGVYLKEYRRWYAD